MAGRRVVRERLRAAARKAADRDAQAVDVSARRIASGVYAIALELCEGSTRLPMPVYMWAPLSYSCEIAASVMCKRLGLGLDRQEEVAQYLMAGFGEYVVALLEGFDVEHFEAWTAAKRMQDEREEVGGGESADGGFGEGE